VESKNNQIQWEKIVHAIADERDEEAFKTLFLYFYDDLTHFSTSILRDETLAEDLVSELMAKIWFMGESLLKIKNIKTYLFIAIKNQSLNVVTKNKSASSLEIENNSFPSAPNPEEILISKELTQRIEAAVDALPPKCSMAFTLVKDNACTYKEAATIMEVSTNTIDRHIQIALSRIQEAVEKIK
jgi:RNA polymerase sigma factor (sigma-70 family)